MTRTRSTSHVAGYIIPRKYSCSSTNASAKPPLAPDTTGDGYFGIVPLPASAVTQETTDVVIPQFERKRASGQCFFNPLTSVSTEETVTCKGAHEWYSHVVGYGGTYYYHYRCEFAPRIVGVYFGSYTLPTVSTLSDGTIDSCLTNAISQTSVNSANALETFAELGETVETLRSVLMKAYRLCRNFRKLALQSSQLCDDALTKAFAGNSSTLSRAVRDSWLELRYGIRPLVYDVQNWTDALTKSMTTTRFRGTSSASSEGSPIVTAGTVTEGTGVFNTVTTTSSWTECHAGCLAQLDLSTVNNLSSRLGANRILQTAWELVPYSFVIDWFLNIGKTIDSWIPQPGVTTLGTWRTLVTHQSYEMKTVGFQPGSNVDSLVSSISVSHNVTKRTIVRVGNPATPVLPSLSVRLSTLKIADLLGLLSQIRN